MKNKFLILCFLAISCASIKIGMLVYSNIKNIYYEETHCPCGWYGDYVPCDECDES